MNTQREASAVPFEVVGLAFAVPVGLAAIFGEPPVSIQDVFTPALQVMWALSLSLGSALALAGLLMRHAMGIYFEQIGVAAAGAACVIYAAALGVRPHTGFSAFVPVALICGYGIACLWRAIQLQILLNRAARILELHQIQQRQE